MWLTDTIGRELSEQDYPKERRAARLRPGPLRVDLQSGGTGTLVDLSEFGALLDLPTPNDVDSHVSFDLHWENVPVRLHGRVVRSTPRYEGPWRIAWTEPASYHVAVEFFDLAAQCATTLRDLLQKASQGSS
jgi:hypothetical protein